MTEGRGWERCPCLVEDLREQFLGEMYCEEPRLDTKLVSARDTNLRIEGSLARIRPHIAGVMLRLAERQDRVMTIDAYRLIETFLDQDAEYSSTAFVTEPEILVILLGFGDPRNKYLPELVLQALSRRELVRKPTWVVLGIAYSQVQVKYSETLYQKLGEYRPVQVK